MTIRTIATVMVLAHNEERTIQACLDSIMAAEPDADVDIYVIANGCTDRTEDRVREYARTHGKVQLVSLAVADKCNAWNVFIHQTVQRECPNRENYFFMNGDARVVPGSFSAMARALAVHPVAHAASAVPASGRNHMLDAARTLAEHGLMGNLYALRGSFVERLQSLSVRMPLNMEGDDVLLGALVKWDLAPERNERDHTRIVPCAQAAFVFEPLSLLRPADWIRYWKRLVRYARRGYEFELLQGRLREKGISGMPADIKEVYQEADSLQPRWRGRFTVASWIALRHMQKFAKR